VIQLEVILTERLYGLYTINCSSNTVGPVASGSQVALLIVDSKQLCVTDYKPRNVSVGVEFQVRRSPKTAKISIMAGNICLFIFASTVVLHYLHFHISTVLLQYHKQP
jgi:hypothetical protein